MRPRIFLWGGAVLLTIGLGVGALGVGARVVGSGADPARLAGSAGDPAAVAPWRSPSRPAPGASSDAASEEHVAVQPQDCWVRLDGVRATCAVVSVPAARPRARRVDLAVLRVPARAPGGRPPLVFLGGGPGQPVLEHLSRELRPLLALADNRELIFIDPRGTGFSTPKLVCRQGPKLPESLRRCFEEHSVENDPADFTTAAGARDLVAVQRAFGHAKWDVFATSYGTRLALTLLREAPERVGALVLDSPVPLEVDLIARLGSNAHRGLEAVFSACASQTDCARAFPELRESTYALFDDLGARPHVFPAGTVDRESFVRVVLALLYAPKATAYLPQLLFRAARGDDELFWQLASSSAARDFALGVHLSVQCAEEVPFTSPELVARADEAVPPGLRDVLSGKTYLEDCRSWPVPPAGPGENRAVEARVRALVLGGELDPVTPPEYGRRVFEALAGSSLLRVRGASHGVGVTPCGLRAVAHFLDAPEEPLGVDCFGTPGETTRLAPGEEREVGRSIRFRTAPPSPSELREVLEAL